MGTAGPKEPETRMNRKTWSAPYYSSELSGCDMILVHRLLKNAVPSPEYILMTDTAYADIAFPQPLTITESSEQYEHPGRIRTLYCDPCSHRAKPD